MSENYRSSLARRVELTIAELAERLDASPLEALDEAISAGVSTFWHEGHRFTSVDAVEQYLAQRHFFDPLPDLQFEMTAGQARWLAAMADVDLDVAIGRATEPRSADRPRKFVGSESCLENSRASRRREQIG